MLHPSAESSKPHFDDMSPTIQAAASHIAIALKPALLEIFVAQVAEVEAALRAFNDREAIEHAKTAMCATWSILCGVTSDEAAALAELATRNTANVGESMLRAVVIARCSLQRALVAFGLGERMGPLWRAAAAGLITANGLGEGHFILRGLNHTTGGAHPHLTPKIDIRSIPVTSADIPTERADER